MSKTVKAIGYVRQSRRSESAATPEAQRQAIEHHAKAMGWKLVETFSDLGRSGYDPRAKRPGLDEAISVLRGGGVERFVVFKVDRLTRRGIKEAIDLVERIRNEGADLVSVTENIDTSSAMGEGFLAFMFSMAKSESEKIAERVLGARGVVRGRGGFLGGPVTYGWKSQRVKHEGYEATKLVLDEDKSKTTRRIVDLALKGESHQTIADKLNADGIEAPNGGEWTYPTVMKLLRNPVLAGMQSNNAGDVLRDDQGRPRIVHEPLVTTREWKALQTRLKPRTGRRPRKPSLLGGIAVCSGCGATMGADHTAGLYRCNTDSRGLPCDAPARASIKYLDDVVMRAMAHAVLNPDADPKSLKALGRWWAIHEGGTSVVEMAAERDEIEQARARLREMNVAGDFADDPSQYRTMYNAYAKRWATVTKALDETERMPPAKVLTSGFIAKADLDTKRSLISDLFVVKCHRASARGVAFKAWERVSIELRDSELRIEITASDYRDPEESNKYREFMVRVVDKKGRRR